MKKKLAMISWPLIVLGIFARGARTQTDSAIILTGSNTLPSSFSDFDGDLLPTGSDASYISYTGTSTLNTSTITSDGPYNTSSSSPTSSRSSPSSATVTLLQGSLSTGTSSRIPANSTNSTSSSTTTTSAPPRNTRACNHHPEFCTRRYSNITYVAAHNSPFVNANNAAANQLLPVSNQLDDGIRMLQGQTHYNSSTGTISYCHSSCDLLNAGTAEAFLKNITRWVRRHPYDVVSSTM